MQREAEIIKVIEKDLASVKRFANDIYPKDLDIKWENSVKNEPRRFINSDFTIKKDKMMNFRKYSIFVPDYPSFNPTMMNPKNLLGGGRRGVYKLLIDSLNVIKKHNYEYLLEKYPCSNVGNPFIFNHQGYRYTFRWAKHIYSLGLFKQILGKKLREDFTTLDIGSSYGIFSCLLKREFKRSHCVLLDFPEQLVMAHYFLAMNFPDASIAGFADVCGMDKIDRDFLEKYDFILIPWFCYKNIAPGSIDLITNFASFGEMKRKWFEFYTENGPFKSSEFLFTINRFQSAPTFDTDLTILDYPLGEFRNLHFGICDVFSHEYVKKYVFFNKKTAYSSQYFEFIGRRDDKS